MYSFWLLAEAVMATGSDLLQLLERDRFSFVRVEAFNPRDFAT